MKEPLEYNTGRPICQGVNTCMTLSYTLLAKVYEEIFTNMVSSSWGLRGDDTAALVCFESDAQEMCGVLKNRLNF